MIILVFTLFQLKLWLSLLIPKIEDGNNFGVSVQEDTLAEIEGVEAEAIDYLEHISRYYTSRGKLISKVCIFLILDFFHICYIAIKEIFVHTNLVLLNYYCFFITYFILTLKICSCDK